MSRTRVNMHVRRSGAVVAGVLLPLTGWLPVATASPPPDSSQAVAFGNDCPLQRVGTQFIRCDNLTGAGVQAPSSIPEMTSRAVRKHGVDGLLMTRFVVGDTHRRHSTGGQGAVRRRLGIAA
jgi:hypothetical protein